MRPAQSDVARQDVARTWAAILERRHSGTRVSVDVDSGKAKRAEQMPDKKPRSEARA